jgi:DNA repair protein RadC
MALAADVLQDGGFAALLQATPESLKRIKGLGPAKRAELLAVMEMARRALVQQMQAMPVFDSPSRVKDYLALHLGGLHARGFCGALSGRPAPAVEARRPVLRHADADLGLPA